MLTSNLAWFILSCIGLFVSGTVLVKSISKIASFLRVSEFSAGFFIMAFSTSLPELFVGIQSAIDGVPSLSLGNVIGSNIADLTLVAGIAIILGRRITVSSKTIQKDALLMVGMAFLPLLLMYIGREISRLDGVILLTAFFWFEWRMLTQRRSFKRELANRVKKYHIILASMFTLIGMYGLIVSSDFAVHYAKALSFDLGLPAILIGLILLALGTSLPELTFESTAVIKGHPDLALGDLVGSIVTNSTLVLGLTALIAPISNDFFIFVVSGLFMIAIAIIFAAFVESKHLTWKVGIGLVLIYIFYIIVQLELKGVPVAQVIAKGISM